MPGILATPEVKSRRIAVEGQSGQTVRPYLANTQHKKRVVEWLKW
jgi:hypothetical protein